MDGMQLVPAHNFALLATHCRTQAEWALDTYLSLPWRPRISILGATDYTLNDSANQVCVGG
jgi:hypothetical protein